MHILSGVHGGLDGSVFSELRFYQEDLAAFGQYPKVNVYNVTQMAPSEIAAVVNGPGTVIGAFCNSGACLAPLIP